MVLFIQIKINFIIWGASAGPAILSVSLGVPSVVDYLVCRVQRWDSESLGSVNAASTWYLKKSGGGHRKRRIVCRQPRITENNQGIGACATQTIVYT